MYVYCNIINSWATQQWHVYHIELEKSCLFTPSAENVCFNLDRPLSILHFRINLVIFVDSFLLDSEFSVEIEQKKACMWSDYHFTDITGIFLREMKPRFGQGLQDIALFWISAVVIAIRKKEKSGNLLQTTWITLFGQNQPLKNDRADFVGKCFYQTTKPGPARMIVVYCARRGWISPSHQRTLKSDKTM